MERGSNYMLRGSQFLETDQAFEAWTTQDIDKMKQALHPETNPVDRHFLLMGIVDQTYKDRKNNEDARSFCAEISEKHIEEFSSLKPVLVESLGGILPRVPTFQKYATLLTEQGNFSRAIEVCELAISHGLHDGTKAGFEGRIARIRKEAKATDA